MTIFEISLFEISIPLDNRNLPKLTILNFCHHFVCENSASSLGEITRSHNICKKMVCMTIDKGFPVYFRIFF